MVRRILWRDAAGQMRQALLMNHRQPPVSKESVLTALAITLLYTYIYSVGFLCVRDNDVD